MNVESGSQHSCVTSVSPFMSVLSASTICISRGADFSVAIDRRCVVLRGSVDVHTVPSWLSGLRVIAFLVFMYIAVG